MDLIALDEQRGIATYRGLYAPVSKVWRSPSGRLVAALSNHWHLGVWDADSGRLRFVLDVPPGVTADNADLAFGRNEAEVVFSTGTTAVRWDLSSGRRSNTWKLPAAGLVDQLIQLPSGNWFLFRAEVMRPYEPGPWVCRGRELLPNNTFSELYTIDEFSRWVNQAQLSTDGTVLLVYGASDSSRSYKLFDGRTGKALSIPGLPPLAQTGIVVVAINPAGTRLMVRIPIEGRESRYALFELPTGRHFGDHPLVGRELDDGGSRIADCRMDGLAIIPVGAEEPILRLDYGTTPHNFRSPFSSGGRFISWGRSDGTVCVADWEACRDRLGSYGVR